MLGCYGNTFMCFLFFTLRHSFMQQCWSVEPKHRPAFIHLVETLSSWLECMADYVHIGAFGIRTQNSVAEGPLMPAEIVLL